MRRRLIVAFFVAISGLCVASGIIGCGTQPPNISTACQLADDICQYSNAICELLQQDRVSAEMREYLIDELQRSRDQLYVLNGSLQDPATSRDIESLDQVLLQLIDIRDRLKFAAPPGIVSK